ncbi:Transposon Ty3-I Gag-Pol polyprotein [Araneus ventricosus]|uniref:Transposon Ty3-I Gag-Pol polyprotein n=1 Tax=Araneus ventricosus TaxID=182803 RepID=A0A4Y2PJ69_ARAVE|nr:Transposon Ty3-I Gag-Pol polyprotein [Araneus ventricosus]
MEDEIRKISDCFRIIDQNKKCTEDCEYGVLHDELIRDRIVVGIRDKNLSEKLQLDADFTLTKVIERVRLSEVIKEQQEKLIEKDLMKGCYSIKLKLGAIPFAITSHRRVPIPLLKQTKAELERMVEEKVNTPVLKPTEWYAPVVIMPKNDGNVRNCGDLVEFNKNVIRELHPLPKAEYFLNLLAGAKIFTKLNANSGFWQIPLDKKSSYLTTFITPFGRFRFQRLPFGISSEPEHFQRRMSQMIEGIP